MQEVVVTRTIEAPREDVERVVSPAALVEYAGTYDVEGVEATDDGTVVTAATADLETALVFTETPTGYVYRQRGDHGPFAAMYASVAITGSEPTEVIARSCYTFGLPLSRVTDWFARRERRIELRRLVAGIAGAVDDGGRTGSAEPVR